VSERIHFEARLGALADFHESRLPAAPESERTAIQSRVLALRVAGARPQSELPMILFLSRRPAANEVFSRMLCASLRTEHAPGLIAGRVP
jgi:hypothetical protein